jgi:hypothetical protein
MPFLKPSEEGLMPYALLLDTILRNLASGREEQEKNFENCIDCNHQALE